MQAPQSPSAKSPTAKPIKMHDPAYTAHDLHKDVEDGKYAGFFGGCNAPFHALAEARCGNDLAKIHMQRTKDEHLIQALDDHLKKPATQSRWAEIVSLDPYGMWSSRPTMAATTATMYLEELKGLPHDGTVVGEDGGIRIVKCAVDHIWNIPGMSARLSMPEDAIRDKLYRYTQNDRILDKTNKAYVVPIGGVTAYFFGDIRKLSDPRTEVAVRVHDECNGSDVFGTDICTCRPYLIFAIQGAVECAQRGGVGVVAYFRKEGRALGECTKFRVYNARKSQQGGDRPETYFFHTESIAGVRDARFQELMPDILLWLGIKRIDWLLSMSSDKYDAIRNAGIEVMQRISIPDDLVPGAAQIEIKAKVSAGYHTESISTEDINKQIRSLEAVRERSNRVFELAKRGKLVHFTLDLSKLPAAVEAVVKSIKTTYPKLNIPFHSRMRHFEIDGVNTVHQISQTWRCDPTERTRRVIDLITVACLLDAGAGPDWKYVDADGNTRVRSEGLATAVFDMFLSGQFSSDEAVPHRVNSLGLKKLELSAIQKGFQVSKTNPLVGVKGRLGILHRLAEALESSPEFFGTEICRPGYIVDYVNKHTVDGHVSVKVIWRAVIEGLQLVWPTTLSGVRRGDVWSYNPLKTSVPGSDLVPFHKLSQWLLLSIMEPLIESGIKIDDLHLCTGLAEYRNGGLFIDTGVLTPRNPAALNSYFDVGSELVIEWRACTICLLDLVAEGVRKEFNLTEAQMPLPKVLEGGTWRAGRIIAAELRKGGPPPIHIRSDGTVF
ncbi:unnamed protein product (mitochondrion) [Plasmodiophora brassicae]|uniref:GTP cyclohydrolase II domain-containing protein n=1 Tax=Plasmodiophora brassicae TaxID=37360 RepID=A0A0G4J570_PLABS|nr:hypothetical protein PBRA_002657 [Plasmodiophora brassicae]SPQ94814.1 unnamed protein product [Plasmodiophora brassicae]